MIYYFGFLYIILSSIYTFSFARYSWRKNNKLAAVGAVLMVMLSIAVSTFVLLRD
jgi:hypothetical protein